MGDYESISHTKYECKYHIVFIPKYRKKKLYGQIRQELGVELRRLAEQKGCRVLEGHMMSDHIHILMSITAEVQRVAGGGVYQGEERDMDCACIRRATEIFQRAAHVGERIFRVNGGS